ncbi:hypothetical protein RSAG8_06945, partial [Rhizoctonia solani AG-8 WAC10335]
MQDSHSASAIVRAWEEATESLSKSLSSYLDSCISLENYSQKSNAVAREIAPLINFPSLDSAHTKFFGDLVRASFTLARMRNAVLSRFNTLPKEIISQIFLDVVYSSAPTDKPNPSMLGSLETILTRIDNLLSVSDSELARPTRRIASLSLQRSWESKYDNRLYLAAILPSCYNASNFPAPNGRAPRFSVINIQARTINGTINLLSSLIESQSTQVLSELSIYHYHIEKGRFLNPPQHYLTDSFPDSRKQRMIDLMGSLSVLRIRKVNIRWDEIAFSNRLVRFHLEAVTLGGYSKLTGLLQTLQSAPELRELKFGTVFAFPESSALSPTRIVFPKLGSLYLENLDFGVLQVIIDSVAPGSHHRTLYLTSQASYLHMPAVEAEIIDFQRLAGLLKSSRVNTLLLNGYYRELWIRGPFLGTILESLPTLVTLQFVNCGLTEEHLLALERPEPHNNNSETPPLPFPSLIGLSLINTSIGDVVGLKRVVESHRPHSVELSSSVTALKSDNEHNTREWGPSLCYTFTDDDHIVQWLRSTVPQFHLVDDTWGAKHDLRHGVWPLW